MDLSDPTIYSDGDPESIWAQMRASSPVHFVAATNVPDFWAVLSYEAIVTVLKDSDMFMSSRGMRLDHEPAATAAASNRMLIVTDPPRHGRIRRIVNSAFTPRMVARLEQNMRTTAASAMDAALDAGTCDFTEVAAALPVAMICDMLGIPAKDRDYLRELTVTAFGGASGRKGKSDVEAHIEILVYCADLVDRRRREPGDDIVTALTQGEVDGVPLTDDEIILNCDGLISGANETTRHAITKGLLALVDNPDQWQMLAADHELLPSAVQEILRYTSPALHVLRTTSRCTDLAGHQIAAGERVAVFPPAGNRDESVFPAPLRFDITRSPNRHLTFAAGTHFCLGSALATSELTVMFDEIVRRVAGATPTGPIRRLRSNLIWGIESFPVELTPK